MVAAAKLRRAQDRMLQLRPYSAKLSEIIGNVVSSVNPEEIPSKLVDVREVNNILVLIITSNRVWPAPFNANIIKETMAFLKEKHGNDLEAGKVQFMCLGRKGHEFFKKRGYEVNGDNYDVFSKLSFDKVNEVVDQVFEKFESGEVDKVYVAYNEFKNVMSQIKRVEPLLPLAVSNLGEEEEESSTKADYIFEPDREEILMELIPKALRTQVFKQYWNPMLPSMEPGW